MKVLIHAGIHRTGTTSLQGFLANNRKVLRERGFAYPGEARNHQQLAWSLKHGKAGAAEVRALIDAQAGADTVILSAEDFCIQTDLGWLRELSAAMDVRVHFYLRRQDHWMMSWYNQQVKWPFLRRLSRMDKTAFLGCMREFHWLDYAALIERWSLVLGPERVSAAVVEKGQVEDVVEDFLSRLSLAAEGFQLQTKRRNDSLPVHVLEIARHLGLFEMRPKHRMLVADALMVGLAHKAQPANTVYSPRERKKILAGFAHSNQAAARRLFGRDALFIEALPAADDPWFEFPKLTREELLREWIAPVIHEMLPQLPYQNDAARVEAALAAGRSEAPRRPLRRMLCKLNPLRLLRSALARRHSDLG